MTPFIPRIGLAACCLSLLTPAFAADAVTYPLEDFETRIASVSFGRPEAKGAAGAESVVVREGKRALRFSWDLTAAAKPDNNYAMLDLKRPLAGRVQAIEAWVHAGPDEVGVPLNAWIRDAGGEIYIARAEVAAPGWSSLRFDFGRAAPAWDSGDKNRRLDLPARLLGLAVEKHGSRGSLVLDALSVTAAGEERDFIQGELLADQQHAIGWGVAPTFRLVIRHPGKTPQPKLVARVIVTDALTGAEVTAENWSVASLAPGQNDTRAFAPALPSGVYDLRWEVSDARGPLPSASGALRAARMHADASAGYAGDKERTYVRNGSLLGGIFWSATQDLDRVARTGGVWERFGNTCHWKKLEPAPGRLDVAPAVAEVRRLRDAGMNLVFFNTVYNQPDFYQIDRPDFAPAYGRLHVAEAEAFGDAIEAYELGNEDNGPTKFLYAEIARHGAAGVRSRDALALLTNSGTAQIDIGWLRLQARRGVLDRMDALVTHPYSWSSTPEAYGTLEQLGQVEEIIDELGGMKVQLTTEWGYPHTFDQLKRAQWSPRHLAIAAAAGLHRHGLYAFDNHFGIYDHGRPYPVAATINAHAALTRAHRFAGWLQKSDRGWVAVYEKAGRPLLMAWAPKGAGSLTLNARDLAGRLELRDLFGNARPAPAPRGDRWEIPLDESPVYLANLTPEVTRRAYAEASERAQKRYQTLLARWPASGPAWTDAGDLRQRLLDWNPASLDNAQKAVVAQALRRLTIQLHAEAAGLAPAPARLPVAMERLGHWRDRLRELVASDLDSPDLRWVLLQWGKLSDERAMLVEAGQGAQADHLAALEPVFDHLCHVLSDRAPGLFFPLWAYAHRLSPEGKLVERLEFIPGKAVTVKVRLHSYSGKSYTPTVRLDLPAGWTCQPAEWSGEVKAGATREIAFAVTADAVSADAGLATVLAVSGKPVVRLPIDDFAILPPFGVTAPVLSKSLPGAPLPLQVDNHGDAPFEATLRILESEGAPALARTEIKALAPGETRRLELGLPPGRVAPPFHAWTLLAEVVTADAKRFVTPLTVDFDFAVRAEQPPAIDGVVSDWADAAPLHIDKEAYAHGSFSAGWSAADLSGTVFTKWDERFLYFAARVTDQLFNQELSDADSWNQDSVQIALAGGTAGDWHEFTLALTPRGPQIWGGRLRELVKDGSLRVTLLQGETIYEAAIPWSAMPDLRPSLGAAFRFGVLLNDDDAIINRRTMERYGTGIQHSKRSEDLGYLHLGAPARTGSSATAGGAENAAVFREDFEEYEAGAAPDRWTVRSERAPVPSSVVQASGGVGGSRCLRLDQPNPPAPHVFLSLTRPLTGLVAGERYRLSARVKGADATATGTILGICSDRLGNEGQSFIPPWRPSADWQEVAMEFTAPGGDLNLIIRNERAVLEGLLIDDIRVAKAR